MKVKLRNLVDAGILNLEWVGVSGESEFKLENGDIIISHWNFLKTNYDEDYYNLDDKVNVSEIGGEDNIYKIINDNGTTCIVKFCINRFYR